MTKLLLIDGNSLGFAAQSAPKLHSAGRETQAIFGFLRMLRRIVEDTCTYTPIVAWDGQSWRKEACPVYKANRDEDPEQAKERSAYKLQRPYIARALHSLGVRQHSAANLEADDIIALTVERMGDRGKMIVMSGDRDLIQLVRPNVVWQNPIDIAKRTARLRRVCHEDFVEQMGYETTQAYVQGKALLGDISDNLKGVDGLGEKSCPLILQHWKSVPAALRDLRENGEKAIPPELSKFRKKLLTFASSAEAIKNYQRNMQMMELTRARIPEAENLRLVPGTFNPERFGSICEELGFASILRTLDDWTAPFARMAGAQKEAA